MPLTFPATVADILRLPAVSYDRRGSLPPSPGLYFVVLFQPTPKLLYIGQSQHLKQRWQNHHRLPELELQVKLGMKVAIAYQVAANATEAELLRWEREAIERFHPPLNDQRTLETRRRDLQNHQFNYKADKDTKSPSSKRYEKRSLKRARRSRSRRIRQPWWGAIAFFVLVGLYFLAANRSQVERCLASPIPCVKEVFDFR